MQYLSENYHTHTKRCHHASGEDREYAEAAIKAGIRVLGFSDHTPFEFKDGFVSPVRMLPEEADGYFESIAALREEYKEDIEIHIGFETEYYGESFPEYLDFIRRFPVEYLVLGQHFLGSESDGVITGRATDSEEILTTYFKTVTDAVDTGKFLYVAHPDVINFTGSEEIYRKHTEKFLWDMKERDVVLGLNRYGMFEHRSYPTPLFWLLAGKVGNKAIIELDAHTIDVFEDEKTVCICKEFADKNGIELVSSLPIDPEILKK